MGGAETPERTDRCGLTPFLSVSQVSTCFPSSSAFVQFYYMTKLTFCSQELFPHIFPIWHNLKPEDKYKRMYQRPNVEKDVENDTETTTFGALLTY